jgi:Tol biopolymer transport system component
VRYVPADDRFHLFVVGADGAGTRQLTSGRTNDVGPQWSPDGNTIAFLSDPNAVNSALSGHYMIAVVPAAGGQPVGTASPARPEFGWAPGSNELVFAEVADGLQQIVARNPATTAQRTIVREDVNLFDPVLSPDGARIAYYRCCFAYNSPLVVRDFASGMVTQIGYGRGLPRWSPDGRYLAVTEDQRVRFPTVIYDTTSGAGVQVISGVVAWLP